MLIWVEVKWISNQPATLIGPGALKQKRSPQISHQPIDRPATGQVKASRFWGKPQKETEIVIAVG